MNTERPPKSYWGAFGAAFAILGVALVVGTIALVLLFIPILLASHSGAALFGAVATPVVLVAIALLVLYGRSGSPR